MAAPVTVAATMSTIQLQKMNAETKTTTPGRLTKTPNSRKRQLDFADENYLAPANTDRTTVRSSEEDSRPAFDRGQSFFDTMLLNNSNSASKGGYSALHRENIHLRKEQLRFGLKEKKKFFIIDPESLGKIIWDFFVVLFVAWNAFEIPLRVGFQIDSEQVAFETTTHIFDAFFLLDLIVNFLTTYENKEGVLVNDYQLVAVRYLKTWFLMDLVSALPLDTVWGWADPNADPLTVLGPLEILRLLRLAKIVKILRNFTRQVGYVVRIMLSITWFVTWGHLMACAWHWLGLWEERRLPNDDCWIEVNGIVDAELVTKYSYSLYWSIMTMTTVGYGDITANTNHERFFTSLVMIICALCYASIFGSVSLSLSQMSVDYSQYRTRVDNLEKYLNDLGIPVATRRRVRAYVNYLWNKNHGLRDQLGDLPDRVKLEIRTLAHHGMLRKSALFLFLPKSIVSHVSTHLTLTVGLPFEMIITRGLVADHIYFIKRGQVQVIGQNGNVLCYLDEGAYFGEIPILYRSRGKKVAPWYRISVKAVTHVDLYMLRARDLLKFFKVFPALHHLMWRIAYSRSQKQRFYYDDALVDRVILDALHNPNLQQFFTKPDYMSNFLSAQHVQMNPAVSHGTLPQVEGSMHTPQHSGDLENPQIIKSHRATDFLVAAREMTSMEKHLMVHEEEQKTARRMDSIKTGKNLVPLDEEEPKPGRLERVQETMSSIYASFARRQPHCTSFLKDAAQVLPCVHWEPEDEIYDPLSSIQKSLLSLRHKFETMSDPETKKIIPHRYFAEFEGVGYLTRDELQKAWDVIDQDGSGDIDVAEFIELCTDVAILHPEVGSEELLIRSLHYVIEGLSMHDLDNDANFVDVLDEFVCETIDPMPMVTRAGSNSISKSDSQKVNPVFADAGTLRHSHHGNSAQVEILEVPVDPGLEILEEDLLANLGTPREVKEDKEPSPSPGATSLESVTPSPRKQARVPLISKPGTDSHKVQAVESPRVQTLSPEKSPGKSRLSTPVSLTTEEVGILKSLLQKLDNPNESNKSASAEPQQPPYDDVGLVFVDNN